MKHLEKSFEDKFTYLTSFYQYYGISFESFCNVFQKDKGNYVVQSLFYWGDNDLRRIIHTVVMSVLEYKLEQYYKLSKLKIRTREIER